MRQLKINKSITNRSSAALDKYLVEIGREELISTDEEVELAQRTRQTDAGQPALCCVCGKAVPEPRSRPQRPD